MAVDVAGDRKIRQHHRGVPARGVFGFPGEAELSVGLIAHAGQKGVGLQIKQISAIVDLARPDRTPCGIGQVRLVGHGALVLPVGNTPFKRLGGREDVAQTQIDGVLHGMVNGGGAKQGALCATGVLVVSDAGHAGAAGQGGAKLPCGPAHRVGIAHRVPGHVLVLQAQGVPKARVEFGGEAGRGHGALITVAGAVFTERLAVVLDTGRGLQALRFALRDADGGADGIARVNGRIRAIQHIDPLNGFVVDHVPARRIEAAHKGGDQVAIDIHQSPPGLQHTKAAPANIGIAVAKVTLAHGGAGQVAQSIFGVKDVLRFQLSRCFAGGAVGHVSRRL